MMKLNAESKFWTVTADRLMPETIKGKQVVKHKRFTLIVSDYGTDLERMVKRLTISKFFNISISKRRRRLPRLKRGDTILFDGTAYEIKSIDDLKHQPVKSCAYDSTFILELESPRFKTQICSDEACFIVKQSTL